MKPIMEHRVMNEPKYLYHYTNFEGLKGIIDSKNLWFSDYRSMNDTAEFLSSKPFLCRIIKEAYSNSRNELDEGVLNRHVELIWEIFVKDKHPAYLFCLCLHDDPYTQENGLLSMWRGYGQKGGFGLEFNKQNLIEYLRVQATDCIKAPILDEKVEYPLTEEEISPKLREHLDVFKEFTKSQMIPKCLDPSRDLQISKDDYEAILHLVTLIKNTGFKEEKEYRICLFPVPEHYLPPEEKHFSFKPKIRERDLTLVSYIERPIELDKLIEGIIIGPQLEMEKKKEFLEGYLISQGLQIIKVRTSDISYLPR